MPKNTTMWVAVIAIVIAVIALLVSAKVITLPWYWG